MICKTLGAVRDGSSNPSVENEDNNKDDDGERGVLLYEEVPIDLLCILLVLDTLLSQGRRKVLQRV